MKKITMIFNEDEVEKIKIYLIEALLNSQKKEDFKEQIYVNKILAKIQAFEDIFEEESKTTYKEQLFLEKQEIL